MLLGEFPVVLCLSHQYFNLLFKKCPAPGLADTLCMFSLLQACTVLILRITLKISSGFIRVHALKGLGCSSYGSGLFLGSNLDSLELNVIS